MLRLGKSPATHLLLSTLLLTNITCLKSPAAEQATPLSLLSALPVKELTVFKDGHALVLQQGKMPTDKEGNVNLDYLPNPLLGTFWPSSFEKSAKLTQVVASERRVAIPRTALSIQELLEANPGAEVRVDELSGSGQNAKITSYEAKILQIPERSAQELEDTSPPNSGPQLPQKANVVLLKGPTGVSAVSIDKIQGLTFKGDYKLKSSKEEFRNLLTLKLDWQNNKPGQNADVGLMYIQKGVRWLPSYKINLDGSGNAQMRLEATLVNDLTDLEDVTANLVIGVPSFAFENTVDPMGLQQNLAALSPYFQTNSRTASALSNSMMSQVTSMGNLSAKSMYRNEEARADIGQSPEITDSGRNDDLFIFTVKHISLKKGQRLVLPVAEYSLKYKDIYSLDIPFAPPLEVIQNSGSSHQQELAKLALAPKVMHKIRLFNKADYPLTTSPALIFKDNKLLSQGMMTFAAIGSACDLNITQATEIKVDKSDKETGRTPNAVTWQSYQYGRIDLAGNINITNYGIKPAELEVTRQVLGKVATADNDGTIEMVNVFEEDRNNPNYRYPIWWGWYSWPSWWSYMNGIGKITWKLTLPPDKSTSLKYNWYYYWR